MRRNLSIWLVVCLAAAANPGLVRAEAPEAEGSKKADPLEELGDYERRAVRSVLRKRDWEVEPDPTEKTIRAIHVVTLPVFGQHEPKSVRWLNRLHVTTEPYIVRREILVDRGEDWDREDIEETERNLRDPTHTTLAVAVPIRTSDPDTVDLLVVTRDIWSLRASANFEYQAGTLSNLYASVSENNLLGRQKSVAGVFDMGLGSFGIGPRYRDPNVLGSRIQVNTRARALFNRSTGAFEGTRSQTTIRYPLWNLERTWGGELTVSHADEIIREFRGAELLEYDDPRTLERESVPYAYESTRFDATGKVLYAVGEEIEHRFSFGYRFTLQRPEVLPDFSPEGTLRQNFRRDVLPPRERNSGPLVGYRAFLPEWKVYRNISTYDLPEEEPVGPYVRFEVAPMLRAFGSLDNFVRGTGTAGALVDIAGEGYVWGEGGATSRYWDGDLFDNKLFGQLQLATPPAGRVARVVARGRLDVLVDDTQNRLLFAGGQTSLRGYQIGARAGTRRLLVNAEVRTLPADIGSFDFGAIGFWDMGDAADEFSDLAVRHDVGVGFRLLVPQVNTIPLRFDWAFPVARGRNAWPGRVSLGFGQVF